MVDSRDVAKWLLTQTAAQIISNPFKSLASVAVISNPSMRGVAVKIARYFISAQLRDIRFVSSLIYSDVIAPAAAGGRARLAVAATTPAVAIPAAAIAGAAVGAAISAGTVSMINKESNTKGTGFDIWSPFGGFQLGTVV